MTFSPRIFLQSWQLSHNPEKLPESTKVKKLESVYKLLEGYEFVLRRKWAVV